MFNDLWYLVKNLYDGKYRLMSIAFTMGTIGAIANSFIPLRTSAIVLSLTEMSNNKETTEDWSVLRSHLYVYLGLSLGASFAIALRGGMFTFLGEASAVRLGRRVFSAILKKDLLYYQSKPSNEIAEILTCDTRRVSEHLSMQVNVIFRTLINLGMVLYLMAKGSVLMTIAICTMLPMSWIIDRRVNANLQTVSDANRKHLHTAHTIATEAIQNPFIVKTFDMRNYILTKYNRSMSAFERGMLVVARTYIQATFASALIPLMIVGIIFGFGSSIADPNDLLMFYLYHSHVNDVCRYFVDVLYNMKDTVSQGKNVRQLLLSDDLPSTKTVSSPFFFPIKVSLMNLSFQYPRSDTFALKDIRTDISLNGKMIAIVGKSGSGKSTLVKLLTAMYLPTSGRLLLDETDLHRYDPGWLSSFVVIVPQEPVLFMGTIKDNLCLGREFSHSEIQNAISMSNAKEFIDELPLKEETDVGERGGNLSGGQKQRIALARAMIRQPRLLILDEATSALDQATEKEIQQGLRLLSNQNGTTILTIAHRQSTVFAADRVLVLDQGRLVEDGSVKHLSAETTSLFNQIFVSK
jgi:ABC-type multidrug transport system fused ATPase/permease subunit